MIQLYLKKKKVSNNIPRCPEREEGGRIIKLNQSWFEPEIWLEPLNPFYPVD